MNSTIRLAVIAALSAVSVAAPAAVATPAAKVPAPKTTVMAIHHAPVSSAVRQGIHRGAAPKGLRLPKMR